MSEAKTRVNVPAALFVQTVKDVHAAGGTHADIAEQLGIGVTSVATRISNLRTKHGLPMPNFKRGGGGGARLDVDALRAILEGTGETAAAE